MFLKEKVAIVQNFGLTDEQMKDFRTIIKAPSISQVYLYNMSNSKTEPAPIMIMVKASTSTRIKYVDVLSGSGGENSGSRVLAFETPRLA